MTKAAKAHPDTLIVDELTAFLNSDPHPSGADAIELMCTLITGSGRTLACEDSPQTTTRREPRERNPEPPQAPGHGCEQRDLP